MTWSMHINAINIDGVKECVAFGVPDDVMGEELAMLVRIGADSKLDETSLREALTERIAGFKIPRYIELTREPLLRGATEKFDKRAIRDAFLNRSG